MLKWFKINERNFTANFINVQYTIQGVSTYLPGHRNFNKSCDLTIEVPISNSSDYEYIMNLYDDTYSYTKMNKFVVTCSDFFAGGCLLKSITKDPNKGTLTMEIIGDYIRNKEISERRDEIIDLVLDSKNSIFKGS
jgi:hypothetical protein